MGKTLGRSMIKHFIIVKWNSSMYDKKSILSDIQSIFSKLLVYKEVKSIQFFENVVDRSNRYDLMIVIEMDKEILPVYDESEQHKEWKQKFGKYVENKAIFDFED